MEETPQVEVTVKRGRGRPKGSKNKPKTVPDVLVVTPVEAPKE